MKRMRQNNNNNNNNNNNDDDDNYEIGFGGIQLESLKLETPTLLHGQLHDQTCQILQLTKK